ADLIPTEEGVKHEIYLFDFNPNHSWYYFSALTTDEVLLFKCFDSNKHSNARVTAHAAFDLPAMAAPPQARQSIGVCALVLFPHAAAIDVSARRPGPYRADEVGIEPGSLKSAMANPAIVEFGRWSARKRSWNATSRGLG